MTDSHPQSEHQAPKYILTLDLDWAPEAVIDDSIELLSNYKIPATVFATSSSNVLKQSPEAVEVALHPQATDLDNYETTLSDLKNIYPDGKLVRNHTLLHSSRFFEIYNKYDIQGSSNQLSPLTTDLKPVELPYGITEFPIYFMDDAYFLMHNGDRKFDLRTLKLKSPGLKVLAWHPIHIYLNTPHDGYYQENKKHYDDPEKLTQNRYQGQGTRSLFTSVLEFLEDNSDRTTKLSTLLDHDIQYED